MKNVIVRFGVENPSGADQIREMVDMLNRKGVQVDEEPGTHTKAWCDFSTLIAYTSLVANAITIMNGLKGYLSDAGNRSDKETRVHIQIQIQNGQSKVIVIVVSKDSDVKALIEQIKKEL